MHLDHAARAPPLSVGMWASSFSLDGRIGEGRTQGGTQKVGGPHSASRKRATTKVVVRFLPSILFHPTDPTLPQRQHIQPSQPRRRGNNATTQQRCRQQHNNNRDSTTTTAKGQQRRQHHDDDHSTTCRMPGMKYPKTTKSIPPPITTEHPQDSQERPTASRDAQTGMAGPTGQPTPARKRPPRTGMPKTTRQPQRRG